MKYMEMKNLSLSLSFPIDFKKVMLTASGLK